MKLLPFDYAFKNSFRRPVRSLLTAISCALVAALLVATTAFVRGLERSHLAAAPPDTAILLAAAAERDMIRSAIGTSVADLVAADVSGVLRVHGVPAVSGEIHMGSSVTIGEDPRERTAFLRGVTDRAYLVHDNVTVIEGRLPGPGEALLGRMAHENMGIPKGALGVGDTVNIEGGAFRVSGLFAAPGSTTEAEIWVPLHELQSHAQRDDISCVFVRMEDASGMADIDLFAARRLDLELMSIPAAVYYRELTDYFLPILALAWIMAIMVGIAAIMSGANTLTASVQDRTRELATLRAIGYPVRALALAVVQESLLYAAVGGLIGLLIGRVLLAESSVRMAMTAFRLEVDAAAIVVGFGGVFILAIVGTLPALIRVMQIPVATGLKQV